MARTAENTEQRRQTNQDQCQPKGAFGEGAIESRAREQFGACRAA